MLLRSKYRWQVSRSLEEMREPWMALQARAIMSPFQSYAWIRNWYDHKGRLEGDEIVLLSAWEDGAIVMLFPFALKHRLGGRQLRWLGDKWNDYNAPVIDAGQFAKLTDADIVWIHERIAAEIGQVDCAILIKQPAMLSGLAHPFATAAASQETDSAHAIQLTAHGAKGGFGRASLKRLREKEKALAKIGDLRFGRVTEPLRKRDVATLLLDWKAQQLDARGARNPFRSEDNQYFLVRFAEAHPDMAEVYTLEVGSAVVAAALLIVRPKSAILYQMAYAPGEMAHHSPGLILLVKLIAALKAQGHEVFDLSTGNDPYKFKLCDLTTPLKRSVRTYTARGVLPVAVEQSRLLCDRTVKSNPWLLSKMYLFNKISRTALNRLKRPAHLRQEEPSVVGLKQRDVL